MKSIFFLSFFTLFTYIDGLTQQVVRVDKEEYAASNFFSNISGEPAVRAKFVSLVEGSPFFIDKWMKAIITTPQGRTYQGVLVKLDLMDGTLHFQDAKGAEFIAASPIKEIVLIDSVYNKKFRFLSSFILPLLKEGWYTPLVESKVSLYKAYQKIVMEDKPYGSATTEQRIITKEQYVLVYNDKVVYVKNTKELPSLFTDKKSEMELFIKGQNNKLSMEEKLTVAITYYNSLASN